MDADLIKLVVQSVKTEMWCLRNIKQRSQLWSTILAHVLNSIARNYSERDVAILCWDGFLLTGPSTTQSLFSGTASRLSHSPGTSLQRTKSFSTICTESRNGRVLKLDIGLHIFTSHCSEQLDQCVVVVQEADKIFDNLFFQTAFLFSAKWLITVTHKALFPLLTKSRHAKHLVVYMPFRGQVLEPSFMGRRDDEAIGYEVEIFVKTHMGSDFKHKSAWLFLEDMHKWKNPESTLARQNRLRVTDEEPEHFEEHVLPRPPWAQRIAKSQRSSNSTASSGLNPAMFQNNATTIRVRPQGKDEGYRARDKCEI
ncbi:hypothetical protein Tco_1040996 [Tanacetum coccineum]|uniref:Uncharacterized protein n=1 Tax=Tanacetum coccineum TaxID=301880 RepID=A0ABQ5GFL5_9ASTR